MKHAARQEKQLQNQQNHNVNKPIQIERQITV